MAKIRSLYDAITKATQPEDCCTNILLWLLSKLPTEVIFDICKISGLSITHISDIIEIHDQYRLENSRPDGLIVFNYGKHLLIETKRFPDKYNEEQFTNHLFGGQREFGEGNVWLLFLSKDDKIPVELEKLRNQFVGQVGFISWKSLLSILKENQLKINGKYQIMIEEFLIFAKHFKLGRLLSMNIDEMKNFLEVYPTVAKYEHTMKEKLGELLDKISDRIIMECEERIESKVDNISKEIPCMYRCVKARNWHTDNSGFVFLDILTNKIGAILTGYEDGKEKEHFLPIWDANLKDKYKGSADISSFTWVEEDEDDYAINGGYFKVVQGTEGKLFNPDSILETKHCFYFGYHYDFQLSDIDSYPDKLAKQFRNLLDNFHA